MDGATGSPDECAAAEMLDRLAQFARDAAAGAKAWRTAGALVRRIRSGEDLQDLAGIKKAAARLAKIELAQARTLGADLESFAERQEEERRFRFVQEVVQAFRAAGAEPRPLGDSPPAWQVGRATVTLDVARGKATVTYARETIAEAPLVPARVVDAWKAALGALEKRAQAPERFHESLLGAYRGWLARAGRAFGDRVDAVDLLPEVAVAMQGDDFLADPRRSSFADYPRAQFAWDVARLLESGLRGAGGMRLEIGPATMGSTARKRRVLWLEVGPGGGQYYASLRFATEAGEKAE
ncbi:MAG: hypothetical protein QME96_11865 [Myxococcota bacterium]|nr:hypothetical protein [Myxococcota bacterium]